MFRVAAESYDRFMGRYGPDLARALVAAAGLRGGQRALDVGCGPGALTGELVRALDAEQVAAVDPSAPFAEACRARHPGVRVEVAAAEALPFGDAEFDVVLSQLVLNFMADPAAGVGEMRRVARDGATITAAVWDYADQMTLLRTFWDAATSLDADAAGSDEGRRMSVCNPGALTALWEGSGLREVVVTSALATARYDGFDDLWSAFELGVGPAGAYTAAREPEARARLRAEVLRRLDPGEGAFELSARAWIVTGVSAR
jgi:SAM-dependent methyltransferase